MSISNRERLIWLVNELERQTEQDISVIADHGIVVDRFNRVAQGIRREAPAEDREYLEGRLKSALASLGLAPKTSCHDREGLFAEVALPAVDHP